MTDHKLIVSFGGTHNARVERTESMPWQTLAAWLTKLPKESEAKDNSGWYCPAEFSPAYRDSDNFVARYAITFDFDRVDANAWNLCIEAWKELAFVMYSTWSYTDEKPRFRVVMPLSRGASYDEYQAVVRKVAMDVGIELVARESFVPAQYMFTPLRKLGADWKTHESYGAYLDVDGVLNEYEDWTNHKEWPHRKDGDGVHAQSEKQTAPCDKPGIVGSFCRAFDVPAAIERFKLPYVKVR